MTECPDSVGYSVSQQRAYLDRLAGLVGEPWDAHLVDPLRGVRAQAVWRAVTPARWLAVALLLESHLGRPPAVATEWNLTASWADQAPFDITVTGGFTGPYPGTLAEYVEARR